MCIINCTIVSRRTKSAIGCSSTLAKEAVGSVRRRRRGAAGVGEYRRLRELISKSCTNVDRADVVFPVTESLCVLEYLNL